jgi:hypothetical protein
MTSTYSPTLFSLISSLISEANSGLQQAMDASHDQPAQFVIPKMEMQLKCVVLEDNGLKVSPIDITEQNYYGAKGESELKIVLKHTKM